MVSNDAVSLLISLFSHCHVRLNVPETGESGHVHNHDTSRDVAFYDEVLTAQLSLHIPTSSALPPPQRGHATYALPISIDEHDDDPLEERTEQARATRLALLAILSCLNIDLRGSYVSPRPPLPAGSNVVPPTIAATPTTASNVPHHQRPIPSLDPKDAAYAEPSLPGDEAFFYSTAWQGNKQPSDPPNRNTASERIKARRLRDSQSEKTQQPATSYVTWDQTEERWLVSWSAKVPVIYTRHRHPRPAMLLTTSLALRVSGSSSLLSALDASLTGGSPFLALLHPEASPSWSDHDLLTSLSAGPVYPDESPSQRAARAASALAKLPLSRLPSKVLGSRLVTPERSARDVGRKISSHIAPPSMSDEDGDDDQEGDVTDSSGSSGARSGALSSSSSSSPASSRPSSVSSYSHDSSFARHRELSEKGLVARADSSHATSASDLNKGEAVVTLHRSARCAMDVRSAVGAKMRTTTVENVSLAALQRRRTDQPQEDGEVDTYTLDDEGAGGVGRALLLCVELDNLSESGILFEVESCELDITVPNAGAAVSERSASRYRAKATLMEPSEKEEAGRGFHLAQGEQRNLLYFVHFELTPENATLWPYTDANSSNAAQDAHRNVAIVVHGRPLLLAGEGKEPRIVTPHFSSTWNCTLDMQSLDKDLRRKTAASLPMPEVLESAAAVEGARSAKTPAVAVGGSLKHSASALSAAAEQDAVRQRETRPNPPVRINTGGLTTNNRSNSLQAPSEGQARLSPSPLSGPSAWLAASPTVIPPEPLHSQRIPSLGAGLLAQARLRASSAQQRVVSDASGTDMSLTPRVASSASRFASYASTSRRVFSSTSTGRTASGAPPVDMTPLEKEVLPLPFDRSLSASTPGDYLGGVLINASVDCTNTVHQLDIFNVELFISNRSDRMKSFVFSWSTASDTVDNISATRLNRSSSTSSLSGGRSRLKDAQAIYQSHVDTLATQTAIIPLDQDVSTGPIASGQSVRVYMPLQALSAGVHTLGDLRVYDEETGSERVLRCAGGAGMRGGAASAVVVEP